MRWSLVSFWSCRTDAVDVKENEITGIPELLQLLDLRKAIVTIDEMGCQKTIAAAIVDKGADYIFGLKGNHPTLYQDVVEAFDEETVNGHRASRDDFVEHADKGHGRLETRHVYCLRDVTWAYQASEWPGLKTVGVRTHDRRRHITRKTCIHLQP